MKRFWGYLLALCLLLTPLTPLTASAGGDVSEETVAVSAGAGYGIAVLDAGSGRLLYEENADARLPMASTTKIMTALLALEEEDVDEPFPVGNEVLVEGTAVGLKPGDTVTLRTLAACMLLESGNDAANAAAAHIGGSVRRFVDRMNLRAEAMGLYDTAFRTPSGLDGDAHYTTAYDLARLAAEALENEDFAYICAQKSMRVELGTPKVEVTLYNHNRLLSEYEGCIGIKTGFTKKAGRCLVSAARRNGMTIVCVTLDVYDDWNVHTALLNRCFEQYMPKEVTLPTDVAVTGGERVAIQPITVAVRKGESVESRVWLRPFLYTAPGSGDCIGKLSLCIEGNWYTLPICAARSAVDKVP